MQMQAVLMCKCGYSRAECYLKGVVVSSSSLVFLKELVQVVVQLVTPVFRFAAVPGMLCVCLLCLHHSLIPPQGCH